MSSRTRVMEVVFLLAVISFGVFWYQSGGEYSVDGIKLGMTSDEVKEALSVRKATPWITWGPDNRVERVQGEYLERGGHYLLGPLETYADIKARLGPPDRERTHRLNLPGHTQDALQLLYRSERLSVERSSDGEVTYELL